MDKCMTKNKTSYVFLGGTTVSNDMTQEKKVNWIGIIIPDSGITVPQVAEVIRMNFLEDKLKTNGD